jgi:hypothetical protein
MRLYNAYINLKAAEGVDSGFTAKRMAKQIEEEEKALWTLADQEEKDEEKLDQAERNSDIDQITLAEKREIKDIEDAVNYAFNVIRDAMLIIHTQLDELQELIKHDEVLKRSGFPEEVADELESMLSEESEKIVEHLRDIDKS